MNAILTNTSSGPLSRRDLLKGGALVVGFCIAGSPLPAAAARGDAAGPPDPTTIDSWIAVHADNTATVYLGKGEFGQGNTTGLLQIAGEELDLEMSQLKSVLLDTNTVPNQGATTSSSSIHRGGPQIRAAAAEARQALLALASTRLGVQTGSLVVSKGVVSIDGHPSRSVSYGALLGDKPFNVKFTGIAPQKPINRYKLVGTRVPRVDIPDKMTGRYVYMQQVRVPDMLHGRIVRPSGQGAYGDGAKPLSIDESSIAAIPGARIVRKGDFVGVVAEREWDAVKAARALKVTWQESATLPEQCRPVRAHARHQDHRHGDRGLGRCGEGLCRRRACRVLELSLSVPVARPVRRQLRTRRRGTKRRAGDVLDPGHLQLARHAGGGARIAGRQGPRAVLRGLRHVRPQLLRRRAQAAAVMSQAVGKPVRVQFMRSDELGWDDYGPAHLADVRAGIDANGKLVAYEYHGWQHGWMVNETTHELALQTAPKERTTGAGSIPVNRMSTGSMYAVANRRVVSHAVPMVGYLKGAPLRSPLDLSFAFASEQTIDELAFMAKTDPLEFRRNNIGDERWLGVLNAAAEAAGWKPRVAASALSDAEVVTGRGIGLGTHHVSYGAAVAEIEVNRRTGNIVATRIYGALDAGQVINPALVENQIVGQMIQAVSRTLKEEVTFDKNGVTSLDWVSYPVLRFAEHPHVTPVVVQRLDEPSTGAGEEVMGATAAAVANAFFDATGVRLRQYPLTPERVKAALAART